MLISKFASAHKHVAGLLPPNANGVQGGGDIWLVNLDPTVGSEIQKSRPCVVISPAEMPDHLRIIAPMSTGSRPAPFRIPITHVRKKRLILLDQFRTVDKTRLLTKIGTVNQKTLDVTLQTLQEVFAD